MNTYKDDSAFPYTLDRESYTEGLTKREYFAAMAMQGLITREGVSIYASESTAQLSVQLADALIAELNKDLLNS